MWIALFRTVGQTSQLLDVATPAHIVITMPAWWYFWRKDGCLFFSTKSQVSANS